MQLLPPTAITGPATIVGPVVKFNAPPRSLTYQANLVYGSGGTTATGFIQTSLDGGASWIDVAAPSYTTAGGRKVGNLNSQTAVGTPVAPSDGAMTVNTSQDGILGDQFRVKIVVTGTYVASTLQVDIRAGDQTAGAPNV